MGNAPSCMEPEISPERYDRYGYPSRRDGSPHRDDSRYPHSESYYSRYPGVGGISDPSEFANGGPGGDQRLYDGHGGATGNEGDNDGSVPRIRESDDSLRRPGSRVAADGRIDSPSNRVSSRVRESESGEQGFPRDSSEGFPHSPHYGNVGRTRGRGRNRPQVDSFAAYERALYEQGGCFATPGCFVPPGCFPAPSCYVDANCLAPTQSCLAPTQACLAPNGYAGPMRPSPTKMIAGELAAAEEGVQVIASGNATDDLHYVTQNVQLETTINDINDNSHHGGAYNSSLAPHLNSSPTNQLGPSKVQLGHLSGDVDDDGNVTEEDDDDDNVPGINYVDAARAGVNTGAGSNNGVTGAATTSDFAKARTMSSDNEAEEGLIDSGTDSDPAMAQRRRDRTDFLTSRGQNFAASDSIDGPSDLSMMASSLNCLNCDAGTVVVRSGENNYIGDADSMSFNDSAAAGTRGGGGNAQLVGNRECRLPSATLSSKPKFDTSRQALEAARNFIQSNQVDLAMDAFNDAITIVQKEKRANYDGVSPEHSSLSPDSLSPSQAANYTVKQSTDSGNLQSSTTISNSAKPLPNTKPVVDDSAGGQDSAATNGQQPKGIINDGEKNSGGEMKPMSEASIYDEAGDFLFSHGEVDAAISLFSRAVAAEPNNSLRW